MFCVVESLLVRHQDNDTNQTAVVIVIAFSTLEHWRLPKPMTRPRGQDSPTSNQASRFEAAFVSKCFARVSWSLGYQ